MGNTIEQWRTSVGCWCGGRLKPHKSYCKPTSSSAYQATSTPVLNFFSLVIIIALLVIAGIELNPGPCKEDASHSLEVEQELSHIKEQEKDLQARRLYLEQQLSHLQNVSHENNSSSQYQTSDHQSEVTWLRAQLNVKQAENQQLREHLNLLQNAESQNTKRQLSLPLHMECKNQNVSQTSVQIPTATVRCYKKIKGQANMSGELYEVKLLALLFTRALNHTGDFLLASNMAAAGSFDDIVFKHGQQTIFLQLKHRMNAAKVYDSQLLQLKGDFSLLKYYKSYCLIKKQWSLGCEDLKICERFEDARFVIYSNAKLARKAESYTGSGENWQDVLISGGTCFNFIEEFCSDIYKCFSDLPKNLEMLNEAAGGEEVTIHKDLLSFVKTVWNSNATAEIKKEELCVILKEFQTIEDLSDYKEFLSRLWFFSGQAAENRLDIFIRQEIEAAFGTDIAYIQLTAEVQNWWRHSDVYLTHETEFWHKILHTCIENISRSTLKQLSKINVTFHDGVINNLRANLPQAGGLLHIRTSGKHCILSCLKVHQSLRNNRHLLVDGSTLQTCKREVLAIWGRWCDFLVVMEDSGTPTKFLESQPGKKLIYISESEPLGIFTTLPDEPNLRQLEDSSQTQVLNTLVRFQGNRVCLGDIVDSYSEFVPADAIVQVVKDELSLGDKLFGDFEYYIPRTMQHYTYVQDEILVAPLPVVFAISGMSEVQLSELVPAEELVQTFSQCLEENTCRFFVITDHSDFLSLTKSNKVVYWFHKTPLGLKYMQSRGNILYLLKFISNYCFESYNNVDSITDIPLSLAVVSAEPGMGKSTILTHLALGTKQVKPGTWVIRVNLNDFTQQLASLPDDLRLADVVEFLLEVSSTADEWKPFFRCKLSSMENVCIFFDGYDEISPNHSDKVIVMLKLLQATKLKKLWVTTRHSERHELELSLSTLALTLQPFTETDQRNFLAKFWKTRMPVINESLLNKFITELLQLTAKHLNDIEKEFMGIPLQSELLAEAFENNLRIYSEGGVMGLPQKFDIGLLYNWFVKRKLCIYFEKNKVDLTKPGLLQDYDQIEQSLQENHMISALFVLVPSADIKKFSDYEKLVNKFESFKTVIKEHKEKTGIIKQIVNNMPVFIHRTFVEYFAALWFSRNFRSIQSYLKQRLLKASFKVVKSFFDRNLAHKLDLHIAVLNHDQHSVEILLSTQTFDVNLKDEGGRTALYLAVMSYLSGHNDIYKNVMLQIIVLLLQNGADPDVEDDVFCCTLLDLVDSYKPNHMIIGLLMEKSVRDCDLACTRKRLKTKGKIVEKMLSIAARNGFVKLTAFLLRSDVHVNRPIALKCKDQKSCWATTLHEAARCGKLSLVQFLLGKKADIEAEDNRYKRTTLLWAVDHGELEVVKYLVEQGGDVNARGRDGITPLLLAGAMKKWEIVEFLLSRADISVCDKSGDNILHIAARAGNVDIVTRILDVSPVSCSCCNGLKRTPLLVAARHERWTVATLLLDFSDLTMSDSYGNNVLHFAARYGNIEIITHVINVALEIVDCYNNVHLTPLLIAARNERWDLVELLKEHSDLTCCDESGFNILHISVWTGNVQLTRELLAKSPEIIECRNKQQQTPLLIASWNGNLDLIKLLMNHCNITACDKFGNNIFHIAAWSGNIQLVTHLLECDIIDIDHYNFAHKSPLIMAAESGQWNVIEILMKRSNLTVCDNSGNNVLHFAACSGNVKLTALLLESLVDVNCYNNAQKTPLFLAAENGKWDIVELLLKRADLTACDKSGNNIMHIAVKNGNVDIISCLRDLRPELWNSCNVYRQTPLMIAAESMESNLVSFISQQAAVTSCDEKNNNVLHLAAKSGNIELVTYLLTVMQEGIDCYNEDDQTPLLVAAENEKWDVVLLLSERCDIRACNKNGDNVLHIAARQGNTETVSYLMNMLDVDCRNRKKQTPLLIAAEAGMLDVFKLLSQQADIAACDHIGNGVLHLAAKFNHIDLVAHLLDIVKDVNISNKGKQTPVWLAAQGGWLYIVRLLCHRHADLRLKDINYGCTPLHAAVRSRRMQVVKWLSKFQGDLDVCDRNECTPLHIAAAKGHLDSVRYLVQNNASLTVLNKNGFTPFRVAELHSKSNVVKYLRKKMLNHGNNGSIPLKVAKIRTKLNVAKQLQKRMQDVIGPL